MRTAILFTNDCGVLPPSVVIAVRAEVAPMSSATNRATSEYRHAPFTATTRSALGSRPGAPVSAPAAATTSRIKPIASWASCRSAGRWTSWAAPTMTGRRGSTAMPSNLLTVDRQIPPRRSRRRD